MSDKQIAIKVQDLSKSFRIPLEASSGIKQKLMNMVRGKKGYRDFKPLNDISFEVEEGEFFGIVGRNGSGKSTLLKTIASIYQPESGAVSVNGMLVPFIELGVGFNPELTGRENVFLNGALLGFSHKEMEAMYDEIVAFAELPDFMDERLKNYSSGMQVRLAFSIAIKAQGDILLLDEVLAVGDEAFQQKCFSYFNELKSKNKTVIIVTHDMSAVERFCTRAMLIEKGKIKLIGRPVEVANEYRRENMPIQQEVVDMKRKKSSDILESYIIEGPEFAKVTFKVKTDIQRGGYYIGLTLYKNDSNIGEINSYDIEMGDSISYSIDKLQLNPGRYEVTAALFQKSSRSVLAICNGRQSFLVSGYDMTRGGGMKLDESWVVHDV